LAIIENDLKKQQLKKTKIRRKKWRFFIPRVEKLAVG
jgi:hypothetical protein